MNEQLNENAKSTMTRKKEQTKKKTYNCNAILI